MAYSTQRAVSNGTLQVLLLSIKYIDKSDITVYLNSIATTAFTWATDTSIRFNSVVPNGVEVLLRRATDMGKIRHKFTEGAQFKSQTLDEDFQQILHISQEALEGGTVRDLFNDLDMHGYRIRNLATAKAAGDAVSLGQVKTESASAWVAAGNAQAAASGASASRAAAAAAATAALTSQNAASSSAVAAAGSSTAAGNSASAASGSAQAAANSASSAAQSEFNADLSADAAYISEDRAATSAANASESEQNAKSSAELAKNSEIIAVGAKDTVIATAGRLIPPSATNPTNRADGSPLQNGDTYFNTSLTKNFYYTPAGWLTPDVDNSDLANNVDAAAGAALIGFDGETVRDQMLLDKKLANYAALKAYKGTATRVEITQARMSGPFLRREVKPGDTEMYGIRFISYDGLSVWERDFVGALNADWLGADPEATAAINTQAIQSGINLIHSLGGGKVKLSRGRYQVSATAETDIVIRDTVLKPISGCLVLRSGVTLDLTDGVIIESKNTTLDVIGLLDMDGGGVLGGWVKNVFNEAGVLSGAGSGILFNISSLFKDNINLVFDGVRISNVGSYGVGAQYGDYINNKYTNLYIHDTGADSIDHKVRYGSENISRGVSFDNIITQRHGLRPGITGSAGIDVRGPAQINNVFVLDFAKQGALNAGIRFSAGTGMAQANGYEVREASSHSSMTNFYIDSGDLSVTDSQGLVLLSSEGTHCSDGSILNCGNQGFLAIDTASGGWGTCRNSTITSVEVSGAVGEAFSVRSERVTLVGCSSKGAVTTFETARGNLVFGQKSFTVTRGYVTATVSVQKNGAPLTNGVDYTATDGKVVVLAVGVTDSDVIVVTTPTNIGYTVTGTNATLVACQAQDTSVPKSVAGVATSTFQEIGSRMGENSIRITNSSGTAYIEPLTADNDRDLELRSTGAAAIVMRSRNLRALLVSNPASAVNWLSVLGSAQGMPVRIQAQGADASVNLSAEPKGPKGVFIIPIANVPAYASDSAAAAGGVPVGGFYRVGSSLQVRAS